MRQTSLPKNFAEKVERMMDFQEWLYVRVKNSTPMTEQMFYKIFSKI